MLIANGWAERQRQDFRIPRQGQSKLTKELPGQEREKAPPEWDRGVGGVAVESGPKRGP